MKITICQTLNKKLENSPLPLKNSSGLSYDEGGFTGESQFSRRTEMRVWRASRP